MEPSTGFEPALSAWKAEALPLHHDGIYLFRGMLRGFGFSRFPEPFVHAQGWYKNSQNSFLPWLSLLGYASRPISWILSRSCIFLSFELGLEHCHLVCAFYLPLVYIVIHSLHCRRRVAVFLSIHFDNPDNLLVQFIHMLHFFHAYGVKCLCQFRPGFFVLDCALRIVLRALKLFIDHIRQLFDQFHI